MKKPSMLFVSLLIICWIGLPSLSQTADLRTGLEQGVCAFKNKNYPLAEAEFEKALQQDPANKLLMLFTARAIDFQYKPKDGTPGNVAKARAAIDAYSKLLAADPTEAEAVNSIVRLYEQIDAAKLVDIAETEATPKPIRTAIFIKLASVGNTCANDITYDNKTEVKQGSAMVYRYHMPKDPNDLAKGKVCASDGMKFIDRALALDANSESGWSYKASLLIQQSRLAEMQQQPAEKARLYKEAMAAKAEFTKLADAAKERQAQADRLEQERWEKERPTAADGIASMAKFISTGHLSRKVAIKESSIDSRDLTLIEPPDDATAPRQPSPEPAAPPIVWKTVTLPDGSFSFALPSPFEVVSKLYLAKGEGISFLLTYVDLPPNHPPATPDEIMGGTASAVADSVCAFSLMAEASCDVRFTKKTTLGAYPGLEYAISEDNCIKVLPGLMRVYLTQNRVYALAAIGADPTDPRVAKFFSAFATKK